MSKEIDDFLFVPSQSAAPAAAPQPTELAPMPKAASRGPVAPPTTTAAPVARPPFNPGAVPMPEISEVMPQVAAAASAAKAAAPKPELKSPVKSLSDEIVDNWKPIALVGAGAAAGFLASKGISKIMNRSIKEPAGGTGSVVQGSPATTPAAMRERVDPVFASVEETAAHEAAARTASEQRQRRLEEFNRMRQTAPVPEVPVTPAPVAPAPVAPVAAVIEEAPATAAALVTEQPGSKVAEAVVKDELVKPTPAVAPAEAPKTPGAVEPPARTGSGQPAFPGTGEARARMPKGLEFASASQVPAGMAFVPNAQYYNTLANDARSFAAAQDIVRAKGYPASDKQAREWAAEFIKSTNAPSRTELKAAGGEKENVKGIFKKFGADKKTLVKVGGVAGALTAMSSLANAQTALEAGAEIAGAVLPPQIQAGLMALTGTTLASGMLTPEQEAARRNSVLLGSPYAGTEFARTQREQANVPVPVPNWLLPQAGAGRGFVNPPQRR